MSKNKSLSGRLSEVLLDGYWIANTNYREQLLNTGWKQAICEVQDLNTIAALTFHINYYLKGILHFFHSGCLEIRDKYSFDLPAIQSERDWKSLVDDFLTNAASFITYVEQMPESKLDEPFADEKYGTYSRNIEGVIEHSYYHLGQIVLIRKMIS